MLIKNALRHVGNNLLQAIISIDQAITTVICMIFDPARRVYADETFSARSSRLAPVSRAWKIARRVVDGLLFWDKNHCEESLRSEVDGTQQAPEVRAGR